MADYSTPGYVTTGYVVSTTTPPVVEGTFDLDVGTPGHAKHRTAFASTRTLELAYWQAGSPLSPYDVQPIFVIQTHLGLYAFSDRGVPPALEDLVLQFATTLQRPEPISFRAVPLGANILGSVQTIERSTARVVIDDPTGFWASRIMIQSLVSMPAGLFWLVRQLYTEVALSGTIGALSYTRRQLTIDYGFYKRHFWSIATTG